MEIKGEVTRYIVQIHQPGNFSSIWIEFESSTPFMAINVGDIISPFTARNAGEDDNLPELQTKNNDVRVTRVEHIISKVSGQDLQHKLLVFTEEIENWRNEENTSNEFLFGKG